MEAEKKFTTRRVLREVLSWLWVLAAFLLIQGTLVQARVIPSSSMERTLLVGDHLLVSRLGYDAGVPFTGWHVRLWREPHRQQVIVFRAPLPGQSLDEPYLDGPMNPRENFGPVTVPPASYFVMGDNRRDSYDSRYWGFLPRGALVGTPVAIYMSIEAPEEAWQPWQIRGRVSAYLGALLHPRRVRWSRLFETF